MIFHIPTPSPLTNNSFAYVEVEIDDSVEDAKEVYDRYIRAFQSTGYSNDNFLDDLIFIVKNNLKVEGEEAIEKYEGFSDKQKLVLKEIKNLVARAVSKYKPEK